MAQVDPASEQHTLHVLAPSPAVSAVAIQQLGSQDFIATGRLLLLAAGTKPYQKGFDLLLEAFEAIAPRHPHWDLAIVGLDPQRIEAGLSAATLHRRAHAAGLATRVHFVGPVADMAAWYARAPQGSPRPFRSRCLDRSGGAAGRRHPAAAQGSRVSCHRRSALDMAWLIQQLDRDRTAQGKPCSLTNTPVLLQALVGRCCGVWSRWRAPRLAALGAGLLASASGMGSN